jgi:hypothetical protein
LSMSWTSIFPNDIKETAGKAVSINKGKEYEKEKGYEVVFFIDLTRHMIMGNCVRCMKTFSTNGETLESKTRKRNGRKISDHNPLR